MTTCLEFSLVSLETSFISSGSVGCYKLLVFLFTLGISGY